MFEDEMRFLESLYEDKDGESRAGFRRDLRRRKPGYIGRSVEAYRNGMDPDGPEPDFAPPGGAEEAADAETVDGGRAFAAFARGANPAGGEGPAELASSVGGSGTARAARGGRHASARRGQSARRNADGAQAKGERLVKPYLERYNPATPGYHHYRVGPTWICRTGERDWLDTRTCSVPYVSERVSGVHVPFNLRPKEGPGDVLGQPIRYFRTGPGRTIHINETVPGHMFHPGRVVTAVYNYDGFVYIYTEGAGTGDEKLFNEIVGPLIFEHMHRLLQKLNDGVPDFAAPM